MSVVEQKESWAMSRKDGLGGTDAAAILGLSPWRTPIEVWEDKVHPERRVELDKDCLRWGTLLEPVIRQEYARKFNVAVYSPDMLTGVFSKTRTWETSTIVIGREDWMLGMPDGYLPAQSTGLEIKTASRHSAEWGIEGTDEVPAQYLLQCAWYMAVTDSPAWNLAVLFSGSDLQQFHIQRDLTLEADAIEACREFWHEFVVKEIEPPVDQTESYGRYLARKFSLSTGRVITKPSDEIIALAVEMKEFSEAKKAAEERERLANNQLRALIGDAQKAITPLGPIGWVRPVEKLETDWEAVARELGATMYDPKTFPETVAAHSTTKQNAPYLRAWYKK